MGLIKNSCDNKGYCVVSGLIPNLFIHSMHLTRVAFLFINYDGIRFFVLLFG